MARGRGRVSGVRRAERTGSNAARLQRRADAITDLPPGFRAVVLPSDSVPGLRPGRHVMLLGACARREDALAARDLLPAPWRREVLPRPVLALPALECPAQ